MSQNVLRIDASARLQGSVTRELTNRIVSRLDAESVTTRDLAEGIPAVDEVWVGANFTPEEARTDDQRAKLAASDALIAELQAADTIVIGAPIYNFGVPAALKAWIDQIARAGVTFSYTESGPVGLLTGKRAVVVVASGGVALGSDYDFASGYLRHVLGFIGITDVTFVGADALIGGGEEKLAEAERAADAFALAA